MKYLAFLVFVVFLSCNPRTNSSNADKKEIALRKFLEKFKVLKLPVRITLADEMLAEDNKTDSSFYVMPGDTLFSDSDFVVKNHLGGAKAFGILPDTSKCIHVIWLSPADHYVAALTTYSRAGDIIDEQELSVGKCDKGEPCFDCNETIVINKDYSVYSADTMIAEPCDSLYNPIPGIKSVSVIYKTGIIPHTGKPVFSEEKGKQIQ